jgi:hypothetical protein
MTQEDFPAGGDRFRNSSLVLEAVRSIDAEEREQAPKCWRGVLETRI